ncbi:MAG TPA: DUF4129 domain-containing protein [Chloroflexota bacterium]|jgi:hypothetical protein|nr:DUF4129 domain-containing protein [Chloroflexota bacterium]
MNRLVLTLGLVVMETCWMAPWLILIGWWTQPDQPRALLSAASICGLLGLGALSTEVLGRQAARSRVARAGLVGLGLAVVLVVVRVDQYPHTQDFDWLGLLLAALAGAIGQLTAPVLALAAGLALWWRGVKLGSQAASYSDVEGAFRWGIGLLILFGLLVGLTTRPSQLVPLEAATTFYVVAFFFVSLTSLALGRLESLRSRTRALAVDSQWLAVLLGVAGAVVLVALLLAQLVSFDLLLIVTRPLFELLGQAIVVLLYVLVIPLAWLVELLVYAILRLLQPGTQQLLPQPPAPTDIDNTLQRILSQTLAPELLIALKALAAFLLLALGLWLIARAIARWRPGAGDAEATDEERVSVLQPGGLRALLWAWLQRVLRRRGMQAPSVHPGNEDIGAVRGNALTAASARGLYRELLRLGETAGAHRGAATTPLEHEAALAAYLAPSAGVAALTVAYDEVRYGDRAIPADRLDTLGEQLAGIQPRDTV